MAMTDKEKQGVLNGLNELSARIDGLEKIQGVFGSILESLEKQKAINGVLIRKIAELENKSIDEIKKEIEALIASKSKKD